MGQSNGSTVALFINKMFVDDDFLDEHDWARWDDELVTLKRARPAPALAPAPPPSAPPPPAPPSIPPPRPPPYPRPVLLPMFRGVFDSVDARNAAYMDNLDLLISGAPAIAASLASAADASSPWSERQQRVLGRLVECNQQLELLRACTACPTREKADLLRTAAAELRCVRCIADIVGCDPVVAEKAHVETSPCCKALIAHAKKAMQLFVCIDDAGISCRPTVLADLAELAAAVPTIRAIISQTTDFQAAVEHEHAKYRAYLAQLDLLTN